MSNFGKILFMQDYSRPVKRETNQMVFGIRAVIEAIESGKEIESLFNSERNRWKSHCRIKRAFTYP